MKELCDLLLVLLPCLCWVNAECPVSCVRAKYNLPAAATTVMRVSCASMTEIPRGCIDNDVTVLDLASNYIGVLENPGKYAPNFTHLVTVVLSSNNLTMVRENSLHGFPNLESVDLSFNNITQLPNEVFQMTKQLQRLRLSFNPALVLPEHGFQLASLEELLLDHCNVKAIPLHFFKTMPKVEYVHLEGNLISELDPCLYKSFFTMQFVNLEDNNFTVFPRVITQLLNRTHVIVTLNGNPFVCDCNFEEAIEIYAEFHVWEGSQLCYSTPKHELFCQIPGVINISSDAVQQTEYFVTLNCKSRKNVVTLPSNCNMTGVDDVDYEAVRDDHLSHWDNDKRVWTAVFITVMIVIFAIGMIVLVKKLEGHVGVRTQANVQPFGLLRELQENNGNYN